MRKHLRATLCIITVLAVLLLTGCKGNTDYNNSSALNSGGTENSQSSKVSSDTSSAADSAESNVSSTVSRHLMNCICITARQAKTSHTATPMPRLLWPVG